MSPLELAIVLSAVDNASRIINRVQEKLEGLAKAGESLRKVGEGMTFGGGLIRAAGDALAFADAARPTISFHDEVAPVITVLPPSAERIGQLGESQEFATFQPQRHAYPAKDAAASV